LGVQKEHLKTLLTSNFSENDDFIILNKSKKVNEWFMKKIIEKNYI
jgi:hypothetical protein